MSQTYLLVSVGVNISVVQGYLEGTVWLWELYLHMPASSSTPRIEPQKALQHAWKPIVASSQAFMNSNAQTLNPQP